MHQPNHVQTIRMLDVDSVLLAWQVIEVTCTRRMLSGAIDRALSGLDGSWEKAFTGTQPILESIERKSRLYPRSVDRMLSARNLPASRDLEQVIATVGALRLGDQLVCHTAMALTYMRLASIMVLAGVCSSGPDDRLDRIRMAIEDHALDLYQVQKRDWERTAHHYLIAGIDVMGMRPIPNPFGIDGCPCWHLASHLP